VGVSSTEGLAQGEKRLAELLAARTHRFSRTAARGRALCKPQAQKVSVEEEDEALQRKTYILWQFAERMREGSFLSDVNPTRLLQPTSSQPKTQSIFSVSF
jgi:hypothetical protein